MNIRLDGKYKKLDLNNVMTKRFQHPTEINRNNYCRIKMFEDLSINALIMCDNSPVYLQFKNDAKLLCS